MAEVLVTGGSGLIGWRVVEQLLEQGHGVVVFDLVPDGENLAPFRDDVEVVAGDVTDLTALLRTAKRQGTERIVHLAASIAFASAAGPARAVADNVISSANVFETALALDVAGVSWASTIAVNETRPDYRGEEVPEDYRGSPTQAYGISKLACEVIAGSYRDSTGLAAIGLRPPTAYGIGRLTGGVGLFNKAVFEVAHGRPGRIPSWDPLPAQPIYNRDMAALFIAAAFAGPQPQAVFNTPVLRSYTAAEICEVLQGLRPGAEVEPEPYPAVIPAPPIGDGSRAREVLGFEPHFTLEQGLAEMLDHFEGQPG
ncbi:MAG: NAD(P)-dependent oxidoreductase [Actinobacteria bacterium]|nr:NAD(P)-dependent oxidoreductase [Actinomycetota bacterium]